LRVCITIRILKINYINIITYGTATAFAALHNVSSSHTCTVTTSIILSLAATDYIEARSLASSTHAVYADQTLFTIQRIA
jgi:hypothetical protein